VESSTLSSYASLYSGSLEAEETRQRFEAALKGIREEFDDHLQSINDNTSEIEANYELLSRLEAKVDRVEEQIEKLQFTMARMFGGALLENAQESIELDEREKEVFLILYTSCGDKSLTYKEIAVAVKESDFLVRGYITNMIEKGVKIEKRYVNDIAYISLDAAFRERQAKENIVRLSQRTVSEFTAAAIPAAY